MNLIDSMVPALQVAINPEAEATVTSILGLGFGVQIMAAFVGIILIWLFTRVLDLIIGINFREKVKELDGMSFAVYNGLRFFAIVYYMAHIMG